MYYLRLIKSFMQVSIQAELAYRANFFISLLHSLLNLGTGVLGLVVLFSQVSAIHGWDFSATLALLGAYLVLGALRDMFIGPSLDALAGLDGEVWTGRLDFTLLRPVNAQFVASFHQWRLLPVVDLLLGAGIVGVAISRMSQALTFWHMITFLRRALCQPGGALCPSPGFLRPGLLERRLPLYLGLRRSFSTGPLPGRIVPGLDTLLAHLDHTRWHHDHYSSAGVKRQFIHHHPPRCRNSCSRAAHWCHYHLSGGAEALHERVELSPITVSAPCGT